MSDLESLPEADAVDGAPHPRFTPKIFGQKPAEDRFLDAFQNGRLHHAWMLTGPRGVGKATLAWKFARFLLTQEDGMFANAPTGLETDPEHPIARRATALAEPRLTLARRPYDEKTKRLKTAITVEEIRKLKSFFTLSAADGGYRVAIIDAADEMNTAAANALLKILEEPPEKTVLFLICHQPARLLPTIRSRCRTLACQNLGPEDLSQAMDQAGFPTGAQTSALSELADGSVGMAISLLSGDGLEIYSNLAKLASDAPQMDRTAAITLADKCAGATNAARFDMTYKMILLLITRAAKFGVLQPSTWTEACEGEARLMSKLAPHPTAGRRWAETAAAIEARGNHARAVNLDPSSLILDMCLKINETARS